MTLRYSLLDEPLIRVRLHPGGDPAAYTLPGLFVALAEDSVRDFPALRPHQRHPWHAFLVQLAAIALHHTGVSEPFPTEAQWREALLALTPEHPDGAAWCLVSPPERPAFLQAPVAEKTLAGWKDDTPTPDRLDILITSKNHDLKQQRMWHSKVDDWIFALLSVQTAAPYGGSGNHRIARMNGGYSSRAGLGVDPSGKIGRRWLRDVEIALSTREQLCERFGYRCDGGIALLWLSPWDGSSSYPMTALDPFFVEISRRIRLIEVDVDIRALHTTTKTPRIEKAESDARKGNTGDLWTPIEIADAKALTMKGSGFSYRLMTELLFGANYRKPAAQAPSLADNQEGMTIVARAIAGGNCTTNGYHERRVPFSPRVRRMLIRRETDLLSQVASERVDAVGRIHRLLRGALETLFDNGKERNGRGELPDSLHEKAARFARPFEQGEDRRFFDGLNAEIESEDREQTRLAWYLSMADQARAILIAAFDAGPRSGEQRYRARTAALGRLEAGLRSDKVLPTLADHFRKQPHGQEHVDDAP